MKHSFTFGELWGFRQIHVTLLQNCSTYPILPLSEIPTEIDTEQVEAVALACPDVFRFDLEETWSQRSLVCMAQHYENSVWRLSRSPVQEEGGGKEPCWELLDVF